MQVNIQQKPKTYVVINPVAGLSQLETVREKIEAVCRDVISHVKFMKPPVRMI